ncbi:hypothetical protein [Yersinia ruckeri]|uniref:hypothetical protein n=1 Tax=Yersinia ruckeri TaxID=29486 RepID=UPI000B2581BC|nr:hypothetical protein [Yersinia ruckeri]
MTSERIESLVSLIVNSINGDVKSSFKLPPLSGKEFGLVMKKVRQANKATQIITQ